jgi:hypothetical protein
MKLDVEDFAAAARPFVEDAGLPPGENFIAVMAAVKEKVRLLGEVPAAVDFLLKDEFGYDDEAVAKVRGNAAAKDLLARLAHAFDATSDWSADAAKAALNEVAKDAGAKPGQLMFPLRVALSGRSHGPDLSDILNLLGKDLCTLHPQDPTRPRRIENRLGRIERSPSTGWSACRLLQTYHIMDISVKKLEITRKGKDGLVCKDNIRADITVAFYIRVDATEESVRKVAQMLTPERVSDMNNSANSSRRSSPKPSKPRANRWSSTNSSPNACEFRDEIQTTIGKDLDGFLLQDVAIDYLEQTPLESTTPATCSTPRVSRKSPRSPSASGWWPTSSPSAPRCRSRRKTPMPTSPSASKSPQRGGHRQTKPRDHRDPRQRGSGIPQGHRSPPPGVEAKRLETEEAIRLRTEDMNRAVQEREFTVRKEKERLEQEAVQEGEEARVRRERTVALVRDGQGSQSRRSRRRGGTQTRHRRRRTKGRRRTGGGKTNIEARMTAERVRDVTLIEAEMLAKKDQVEKVVASEAQKEAEKNLAEAEKIKLVTAAEAAREAALRDAERMQTMADAEALAATRNATPWNRKPKAWPPTKPRPASPKPRSSKPRPRPASPKPKRSAKPKPPSPRASRPRVMPRPRPSRKKPRP